MKKYLSIALSLLMALALLAGCGAPAAEAPAPEQPTSEVEPVVETPEPQVEEPAPAIYTAGTYTDSSNGNNGPVTVEVVFTETAIESVTIAEHAETPGISDPAINNLPAAIVEAQSTDVDLVSGATNSSKAITRAVEKCIEQAKIKVETVLDTDILVIGSGYAGLTAAAAAAEAGAKVIMIEKLASVGGTSILSGSETVGDGVDENLDELYEYWVTRQDDFDNADKMNLERVRVFIDNLNPTLNWLIDNYGFARATDTVKSNPVRIPCGLEGKSAEAIGNIHAKLEEMGVTILLETAASELMTDAAGAVVGAKAVAKDGAPVTINASKTILATGGYVQNPEMMELYAKRFSGYDLKTAAGDTGDGMRMAMAIGADYYDDCAAVDNYGTVLADGTSARGMTNNKGLYVGMNGLRLCAENEDRYYIATKYVYVEEGSPFFTVYDAQGAIDAGTAEAFAANANDPAVYIADTLEELAEKMGIPADAFVATVERYNELCEAGVDSDFGKPAEMLFPVEEGPFYAAINTLSIYSTLGGVKANTNAQVLNTAGEVIPNLYAAGAVASRDLYGDLYIGASAVSMAMVYGRIAGTHAAASR